MINEQEKNQIRNLLNSPQWKLIERLGEEVCQRILDNSTVRDSEWETIRATFEKEYQVKGIRHFISEFYNNAQ